MLRELLESNNEKFRIAKSRMEDRESVATELDEARLLPLLHLNPCVQIGPTHVLLAAGKTGQPSVDWCEDHKVSHSSTSLKDPSRRRPSGAMSLDV